MTISLKEPYFLNKLYSLAIYVFGTFKFWKATQKIKNEKNDVVAQILPIKITNKKKNENLPSLLIFASQKLKMLYILIII